MAPCHALAGRLQPAALLAQLAQCGYHRHAAVAVRLPGRQSIVAFASAATAATLPSVASPVPLMLVTAPSTVFSARAKLTSHCLPWLRSSKLRSTLSKKFECTEVYKSDLSSIQVATCADNSTKVVIKTFFKDKLLPRPDLQHKVKLEWDIHAALDHQNIIQAYLAHEDPTSVGLYMEHAGDSDAYSYLTAKRRECMREADARVLVQHTLAALQYLHGLGIVHRDIKSENVFRTADGTWKLGDFGSALRLGDARAMRAQPVKLEGTLSFAAPEYVAIWNGFTRQQLLDATTFKLDSWSVGALAFDVLCGRAPFAESESAPRAAEMEAILAREPAYPSGLSYDAVSFMKQALEKDAQKRPTIRQLAAHPWLLEH